MMNHLLGCMMDHPQCAAVVAGHATRPAAVRHFQQLARFVEPDPQLVMHLQSLLKLSKGRWREAREHAESAVFPDSRMRIWCVYCCVVAGQHGQSGVIHCHTHSCHALPHTHRYADPTAMDVGLLFGCRLGTMDLDRPIGLLQRSVQSDGEAVMVATLTAQQTPAQRQLVRRTCSP